MNDRHDPQIVVAGGGAGAADALARFVHQFSPASNMAMLVALRVGRGKGAWGRLESFIAERTALAVEMAQEGTVPRAGRIYVAHGDSHLVVRPDGTLGLVPDDVKPDDVKQPRPSADRLFTTAAAIYGPRVIGIVLSGDDGDGTAGLHAIKAHGGVTVVQSPVDAEVPSMPCHALRYDDPDHSVLVDELGRLITHLVHARGRVVS